MDSHILDILITINIYIIITVPTSTFVGLTGLLPLGQASFFGLGAYFTTMGLIILEVAFIPAMIIAIMLTSLISFLIGLTVLKLHSDYFILATLSFQMIIYSIFHNWIEVTNGSKGIASIPYPEVLGGITDDSMHMFLIVSSFMAIIICLFFYRLIKSSFGRSLMGMRDNRTAMTALGKNIKSLKIQIFLITSGLIAIAGSLFATYQSFIDPTSFNLDQSLFIISSVLIGGTGNIKGPVLGTIFVIILPEFLRYVGLTDYIAAANLRMVIYGLVLIVLMRIRSQGIAGKFEFT